MLYRCIDPAPGTPVQGSRAGPALLRSLSEPAFSFHFLATCIGSVKLWWKCTRSHRSEFAAGPGWPRLWSRYWTDTEQTPLAVRHHACKYSLSRFVAFTANGVGAGLWPVFCIHQRTSYSSSSHHDDDDEVALHLWWSPLMKGWSRLLPSDGEEAPLHQRTENFITSSLDQARWNSLFEKVDDEVMNFLVRWWSGQAALHQWWSWSHGDEVIDKVMKFFEMHSIACDQTRPYVWPSADRHCCLKE